MNKMNTASPSGTLPSDSLQFRGYVYDRKLKMCIFIHILYLSHSEVEFTRICTNTLPSQYGKTGKRCANFLPQPHQNYN